MLSGSRSRPSWSWPRSCFASEEAQPAEHVRGLTLRSTSRLESGPHPEIETRSASATLGARRGRRDRSGSRCGAWVGKGPTARGLPRAPRTWSAHNSAHYDFPHDSRPMGLFSNLTGFAGRDLAVDLGTANTLVYVRGAGSPCRSPRWSRWTGAPGRSTGSATRRSRCWAAPQAHRAVRPLQDGVIADFDNTERMLRHFVERGAQEPLRAPSRRGVPSLWRDRGGEAGGRGCLLSAGARQAHLIEEPMAAAIGAGLAGGRADREDGP